MGYLDRCAKMNYGLMAKVVRLLAYDVAVINKKEYSWNSNEAAGEDWFSGFMKRHPTLSTCKAENYSLSRSLSFNKHNVGIFSKI